MALRIWGKALATAPVAGALVGAGQLGFGYGLGIIRFARSFDHGAENLWNAQLTWVSWCAMLAAVAGAAIAAGVARRHGHPLQGAGSRIALALLGGLGAAVVVPLSMRPARAAQLAWTVDPVLVVGLAAGLGVLAGIPAAVAVLSLRPLAWNVTAVAATVWLVALVSVVPHLDPRDPLSAVRLGVLQWVAQPVDANRWLDTLGMPVVALLAGMVVTVVAYRRRQPAPVAAVAGAAGAALPALAYLIAGPGLNSDAADQLAPYLGALLAVPAGLLGSLLVAVVRRHGGPAQAGAHHPPAPATTRRPTSYQAGNG